MQFGHYPTHLGHCTTHILLLVLEKGLLYTKGGAEPTFASAKVKNAIGKIGIFVQTFYSEIKNMTTKPMQRMCCSCYT